MKGIKKKIQQIIKFIKTKFYSVVVCNIKKGYAHYYYLCFKDFLKKLLKPKKMIPIKWRTSTEEDFKYLTYISDDLIKKSSRKFPNTIYNDNNTVRFLVQNNDETIRQDEIELTPTTSYIIIEKGYLYYEDSKLNKYLYYANPRCLKTNDNEWVDFKIDDFIEDGNCVLIDISYNIFLFNSIENPSKYWELQTDNNENLIEVKYELFVNNFSNANLTIK